MALHTGAAEERDGDYYGPALNRAARLLAIGHGGQVLLSEATTALVRETLPDGVRLLDLGQHRLKDLTEPERVFQVVALDLASDFPPLASLDARPHNLPTHPTALLGRERELSDVRRLFEDGARLVTLTGPGGTGKTRLSLHVAAEVLDDFEHGVFLVELAPITDPALVPATVAQVLGVRDVGNRPVLESLKEFLKAKTVLLVLDNFEQVVAAAPIVADLLTASPGLAALVTSREPLRVRGEREYAVPPLEVPDLRQPTPLEALSRNAAVALFVERAVAVRSDFALTTENAGAVAQICARLDGLPLAIELAAARVRPLLPEAMLARLDRRLPLLTGGARDLPERQRTLRDTIAWSHDLLDDAERRLFRRLAVFVGGFSLEAAEAVCADEGEPEVDVLEGIESLVAKSLLRQIEGPDGEPRFGMLETIREYGLERLVESGEEEAIRRRHLVFFLTLAKEAEPKLLGREQIAWLRRLDPERDNVRAALTWSRSSDAGEAGLRLAGALAWFWRFRGHVSEGRDSLARQLNLPDGAPSARARALYGASMLAVLQADYPAARSLGRQSAALFSKLGDRRGVGRALAHVGTATIGAGDHAAARPLLEQSVTICRSVGDRWGLSYALGQLASTVHRAERNLPAALALRQEAAAIARELGDHWQVGISLIGAAIVVRELGDARRSVALYREALTELRDLDDRWLTPRALSGLAGCAGLDADYVRVVRLFGAAEAVREASGTREMTAWRAVFDRDLATARSALGDEQFAAAWAEGRAMTLAQAVAYALDELPSA
jgi:predicted ATPase